MVTGTSSVGTLVGRLRGWLGGSRRAEPESAGCFAGGGGDPPSALRFVPLLSYNNTYLLFRQQLKVIPVQNWFISFSAFTKDAPDILLYRYNLVVYKLHVS
jgi:hypothetical protein